MEKIRVAIINSYNSNSIGKTVTLIDDIVSDNGIDAIKCYSKHYGLKYKTKERSFLFGKFIQRR